jgi:putative CocE/NonD family hydrolase
VFVQDTRGRFESGGEFDFITQEYNDSYDVIDWAAAQPWSDGNVGMYGSSYLGMTVLQAVAAITRTSRRRSRWSEPSTWATRPVRAGCSSWAS